MSRFGDFEVENFIQKNENQTTLRKTLGHMKLLSEFLLSNGENRELSFIPKKELDPLLASFFVNVKTKDGEDYEPSSLRGMLGSIERHLKRHNYSESVITDFPKTRTALAAKQKQLKSMGKGNKPKAAEALSGSDIDKLYSCHQLGNFTPASVVNTQWFNNMMYFGMRASTEHRAMMWGDVQLKMDDELHTAYLEFHERTTKTRTGENIRDTRTCPPRMYATPDNLARCPVEAHKFYKDRRPEGYSRATDPYYIAPVTNNPTPGLEQQWFLRGPIGNNKLNTIMKEMAKKANLPCSKTITNTSVRKTLVQRMTDCNVPDNLQVYVTGHKRPESLNNYRQLGNQHKKQISGILTSNSALSTMSTHSSIVPSFPAASIQSASNASSIVPSFPAASIQSASNARPLEPMNPPINQVPVLPLPIMSQQTATTSFHSHPTESMFANSNIHGNMTVNFINNYSGPPQKRRRVRVIESDMTVRNDFKNECKNKYQNNTRKDMGDEMILGTNVVEKT